MCNSTTVSGHLGKMESSLSEHSEVQYQLVADDHRLPLNALIGQKIAIHYLGEIHCIACGRKSKKSYSQGFCYPCSQSLARCDLCIVRPERCHYAAGTCREPEWGEKNCLQSHIVYLANTSGLKVGITRHTQIPTRWIDQGATQAIPLIQTSSRLLSGLVEVALKNYLNDRTDWRKMLKGDGESMDLVAARSRVLETAQTELKTIQKEHTDTEVTSLDSPPLQLIFPVTQYPGKVTSLNFDKEDSVGGELLGIKGQYLILDCGVINMRKFSGYHVNFSTKKYSS